MTKNHQAFLQQIYDTCREMGVVERQHELGALCGSGPTWFSSIKARDQPLSTRAAYTLSVNLRHMANEHLPRQFKPKAIALAALLLALINDRAVKRRDGR